MQSLIIPRVAFLVAFVAFWIGMTASGFVTSDPAGKHPITVSQLLTIR